jgi:hypothetical protein
MASRVQDRSDGSNARRVVPDPHEAVGDRLVARELRRMRNRQHDALLDES